MHPAMNGDPKEERVKQSRVFVQAHPPLFICAIASFFIGLACSLYPYWTAGVEVAAVYYTAVASGTF
jgi:hypothetical protein